MLMDVMPLLHLISAYHRLAWARKQRFATDLGRIFQAVCVIEGLELLKLFDNTEDMCSFG